MAIFIGTEDEFTQYLMPRVLNWVQSITKPYKRQMRNVCQHCGTRKELQAAHIHGRERKVIVHDVLEKFRQGSEYHVDLALFKDQIIEAHMPIEENFLFLCQDCHSKYDKDEIDDVSIKRFELPKKEANTSVRATTRRTHAKGRGLAILKITLDPQDPKEFADKFLEAGSAFIEERFEDGHIETRKWVKRNFNPSSDVIGNLRSRPRYRQGKWQELGISDLHVHITDSNASNNG